MLDRVLDDAGWLAAFLFVIVSVGLQWLGTRGARAPEARMAPFYRYEPTPGAPTPASGTWLPARDALLIIAGGLIILFAWLLHGAGRGSAWVTPFVAGFLLLRLIPYLLGHAQFRTFADALARGGASGGPLVMRAWVGSRLQRTDQLAFAVLFGLAAMGTGQAAFVGGALGCLSLALRYEREARRG